MAVTDTLEGFRRGMTPKAPKAPTAARVVRVEATGDDAGAWVVPLGTDGDPGDMRSPIGPCRYTADLAVNDICLLVWTQELPWAIGDASHLAERVKQLENRLA